MTQVPKPLTATLMFDAPHYERRDLRCRDIVDHAIAVQETSNTMSAFEYLRSHDVAAAVIERVLLEPEHRRSAGAPSAQAGGVSAAAVGV